MQESMRTNLQTMIRYLLFLLLCAISVVNVDIDNLVLMIGVFCAIGVLMIAWDFYKLQKRMDSVKDVLNNSDS